MLTGLHCEWVAIRARNLDCLLRNKKLMNAARRKVQVTYFLVQL